MDELISCGQGGGLIGGFQLMKLRVTLLTGATAPEGSTDVAFRIAAADAFDRGLREAGQVLLEPIMRLHITTPEDYLGDFAGDLQQRRAIIVNTENRGDLTYIEAYAPLKELFVIPVVFKIREQSNASHCTG